MRVHPRFSGLGDAGVPLPVLMPGGSDSSALPQDSVSQSNLIAAQLRQSRLTLNALNQALMQEQAAGNQDFATIFGPQIINAQNRHTTLEQAYIRTYQTIFGSGPDTSGMEQWGVFIGAGVVAFGLILAGLYELNKYENILKENSDIARQQTNNVTYALNQASASDQAGDHVAAAQYRAVAQQSAEAAAAASGGSSATAWIKENWPWVALGVAGLIILPDLI